jgi:hypothetical protein
MSKIMMYEDFEVLGRLVDCAHCIEELTLDYSNVTDASWLKI